MEQRVNTKSVEDILALIQQEVDFQKTQAGEPVGDCELPDMPPQFDPVPELEFSKKQKYHRDELLVFDDMEFVSKAYLAILQRPVDDSGMSGYVNYLRNGGSKVDIILDLQKSAEAKAKSVAVTGLRWFRIRAKLKKLMPNSRLVDGWLVKGDKLMAPWFNEYPNRIIAHKLYEQLVDYSHKLSRHYQQLNDEMRKQQQADKAQLDLAEDLLALRREVQLYQVHGHALRASQGGAASLTAPQVDDNPITDKQKLDAFYLAFEDSCRSTRAEGEAKLRPYLPYVEQLRQRQDSLHAVDLGCGRGEWLTLLQGMSVDALGVDTNISMVETCKQLGCQVTLQDGQQWLLDQADNSVDLITSFHVIEHLPFAALYAWFEQFARVIAPGGMLILETPNPENLLVSSHTFYHDPTHHHPLTPALLEFMVSFFGFQLVSTERLNPYPESAKVKGHDELTERVNGHLCGPQDLGIVAMKVA